jgi:hypothetical protein
MLFFIQATGVDLIKLFWHKFTNNFCSLDRLLNVNNFCCTKQKRYSFKKEWVNLQKKFHEIDS